MAWLLESDVLVGAFEKLLTKQDFPNKTISGFTEDDPQKRGDSLGTYALLM